MTSKMRLPVKNRCISIHELALYITAGKHPEKFETNKLELQLLAGAGSMAFERAVVAEAISA